jgi:signal peptidase I
MFGLYRPSNDERIERGRSPYWGFWLSLLAPCLGLWGLNRGRLTIALLSWVILVLVLRVYAVVLLKTWTTITMTIILVIALISVIVYGAGIVLSFVYARRLSKKDQGFNGKIWPYFVAFLILSLSDLAYEPFRLNQPFSIPSMSTYPALTVGDVVIASRIAPEDLRRGDIVVFRPPGDPGTQYIKRLVGLPGDTIEFEERRLKINSELMTYSAADPTHPQIPPSRSFRNLNSLKLIFLKERLPNGKNYDVAYISDMPTPPASGKSYQVPERYYFFLGDNRDRSNDSRYSTVGYVPAENIDAKVRVTFWNSLWTNLFSLNFKGLRMGIEL